MKKTYRIKTNNQELLIRKQNESDATSWWIEFQKTSLQWKAYRIQDWFLDLLDDFTNILNLTSLYSITIPIFILTGLSFTRERYLFFRYAHLLFLFFSWLLFFNYIATSKRSGIVEEKKQKISLSMKNLRLQNPSIEFLLKGFGIKIGFEKKEAEKVKRGGKCPRRALTKNSNYCWIWR